MAKADCSLSQVVEQIAADPLLRTPVCSDQALLVVLADRSLGLKTGKAGVCVLLPVATGRD